MQHAQIHTEMGMASSMGMQASQYVHALESVPSIPSIPSPSPAPDYDDTPQSRQVGKVAPVTYPLLQQSANTAGVTVGVTPPLKRVDSSTSVAASRASSGVGIEHHPKKEAPKPAPHESYSEEASPSEHLSPEETPSRWNIFHHGITSRRPRGRRGPLSAKSRKDIKDLEWAGGACWRCKILRRKCDPGIPCKNCPAPDLREDVPPWHLIGCRRGNLRDAMPPQVLCTKSRILLMACAHRKMPAILAAESVGDDERMADRPSASQPSVVSRCFVEAAARRSADRKLVASQPARFVEAHGASAAAQHYAASMGRGRYRSNASLNTTCKVQRDRASQASYADNIAAIAWELVDNGDGMGVLEIESVESFILLLETSCVYEVEVGRSAMVSLSLVCLRNCLDALRLCSANVMHARIHSACDSDRCSIHCLRELTSCIDTYIEELSALMFRKVNLRDRRWWLSTFYSLCIQAYVRRALLVIEQTLLYPNTDDDDADVLYSSQYLHLVTVLFIAVSYQYDPLVSPSGGLRLQQSMLADEDGATPEMFVPDRYFAAGRAACAVDLWADESIKSSYQFLLRLLNIGSLDFDMGTADTSGLAGSDILMEGADIVLPLRHTVPLSDYSTPNSSTASFASSLSHPRSTGVISPPSSIGPSSIGPALSTQSSPRTSMLMAERRGSIGSLPSRLSAASVPSYVAVSSKAPSIVSHYSGVSQVSQVSQNSHGSHLSHTSENSSVNSGATAVHAPPPPLAAVPAETKALPVTAMGTHAEGSGVYVCSCCPKRPQRFSTADELKVHQAKKPHICAFCGRRFVRMNEAERHITTIHLRPFSWSCRRLGSAEAAFQCVSDTEDGVLKTYDVCGFCGRQFERGVDAPASLGVHVEVDHKLHECKSSTKKFYREDMFGQHLKLSHAAEAGVWLKFLENACKAEETPAAAPVPGKDA